VGKKLRTNHKYTWALSIWQQRGGGGGGRPAI